MLIRNLEKRTNIEYFTVEGRWYPKYINEYWTAQQRQANPLHEIAYRACFIPQLPRFFIELFTRTGDVVYDPFAGRGTTALSPSHNQVLLGVISPTMFLAITVWVHPRLRQRQPVSLR
ncbi:MAG: hypothetical protein HYX99_00140 [Chloroflexi bacterium]|nr:hypothetical protein [Chloroflexota bacterium]